MYALLYNTTDLVLRNTIRTYLHMVRMSERMYVHTIRGASLKGV